MWKCQGTNGFPILLQVASAAFPRMESSVMVDLSEFGLLVGYLSWVTVYKVHRSKDWMIAWTQVAHAGHKHAA